MLYELPSALADGILGNKTIGFSQIPEKIPIIQITLAKAFKEFAFIKFRLKPVI